MKLNNQSMIGIMVVVVIGILGWLTWKAGDFNVLRKGYTIKASFQEISGLEKQAPVRLNGLEVGVVKDIEMSHENGSQMLVTIWLREEAKLREGATAHIKTMGMMGEKYVGLTSGEGDGPFIGEDSVIVGAQPADLGMLLADGQDVAAQLKEISTNLNERLQVNKENIDAIMANLNVTLGNLKVITDNVKERLEVNEKLIDEIVANMRDMTVNLDEFSADLKENPWKLLYKPKD